MVREGGGEELGRARGRHEVEDGVGMRCGKSSGWGRRGTGASAGEKENHGKKKKRISGKRRKGKEEKKKGRREKEKEGEKGKKRRWEDDFAKTQKGRWVAAKPRGVGNKTARGKTRVWGLGGLGPVWATLSLFSQNIFILQI